KRWHD
ncbi:putative binding component ofABC transporter domain protein, partial [Vibrio parahaemolyticus V-223/04]